jgi:chitodextrinase
MWKRLRWAVAVVVSVIGVAAMARTASAQSCAPPWNATQIYTGSMQASANGTNYQANWWTQGDDPSTRSGAVGSGQPWTNLGPCDGGAACRAVPSVPIGLSSPSQTSNSISLSWSAASAGTGCVVSYRILQNGVQVATASGTSATIGGLSPDTMLSFSVIATDGAGSSAASTPLSVRTPPGQPNTCSAPAWSSTAVFTAAQQAVFKNYLWQAGWWTQGDQPRPSQDGVWRIVGYCGGPPGPAPGRQFLPYVDVTMGFNLTSSAPQTGGHYTLAFIIDGGSCTPVWGGAPTTPLSANLYVTDIAALRASGGDVAISFGGAAGSELGSSCGSAAAIQAAYQAVITKYGVRRVDFDLEGGGLSNVPTRNQAIKALQAANPGLQVSYTLPVLSTGMPDNAVAVISDALAKGIAISSVNVMAMDMGGAYDNGGQMELSAVRAALSTMMQLENLGLSHAAAAHATGVTVMIGQNDASSEVFKLSDVSQMVSDARSHGIGMLSFWSATRDRPCANGQVGPPALGECSSVAQGTLQFSSGFKAFTQ